MNTASNCSIGMLLYFSRIAGQKATGKTWSCTQQVYARFSVSSKDKASIGYCCSIFILQWQCDWGLGGVLQMTLPSKSFLFWHRKPLLSQLCVWIRIKFSYTTKKFSGFTKLRLELQRSSREPKTDFSEHWMRSSISNVPGSTHKRMC